MGGLAKSSVTLGFWDDDLDPELVTELLDCEPTVGVRKGNTWVTSIGVEKIALTGSWRLKVERRMPGDIESQIEELLSQVTADISRWNQLPQSANGRLFCGLFLEEANEGVSLSASIIRKVAERGLSLELDIYSKD